MVARKWYSALVALTTTLEDYDGGDLTVEQVTTLSYDLSPLTGKNARLLVDVREFDAASQTTLMTNLRIETTESLRVTDVMPIIGGKVNLQHSTYRIVDMEVAAPGAQLSEAAMLLIGEQGFGSDSLAFRVGVIE